MVRLGIALMVLAAVWALVALWWWALHGMSKDVASANVGTAFLAFAVGFPLALFGSDAS